MNQYYHNFMFVCRCLSLNYDEKDIADIQSQITREELSWEMVIHIANNYLVTPSFLSGLRNVGLDALLENDIRQYLCDLHAMNRNRNLHLRGQLIEAIDSLNSVGITPLLLKGSGQLVSPIHKDPDSRIMSDLDILIPPEEVPKALDALAGKGYKEMEVT